MAGNWNETETDGVTAQHPLVKDEAAARIRLHKVGLLTSASVYIDFIRTDTTSSRRPGATQLRTEATDRALIPDDGFSGRSMTVALDALEIGVVAYDRSLEPQ